MNYELAKVLKDAGFVSKTTFKPWSRFYCPHTFEEGDLTSIGHVPDCPERIYLPELSELIEACGFDFRSLSLHSPRTKNETCHWIVKGGIKKFGHHKLFNGRTAEEAVTKLYLGVNKK